MSSRTSSKDNSDIEIVNIPNANSSSNGSGEEITSIKVSCASEKPSEGFARPNLLRQSVASRLTRWFGLNTLPTNATQTLPLPFPTAISGNLLPTPKNPPENVQQFSLPTPLMTDLTNRLSNLVGLGHPNTNNSRINNKYFKFAERIGTDSVREVLFDPPWATKIAQLQNAVEVLRQFSTQYVQKRGSIIIRCFLRRDQPSDLYMSRTLGLIATTLSNLCLRAQLSYMVFDAMISRGGFTEVMPQSWGNTLVLIRMRFNDDFIAWRFKTAFNQIVQLNRRVFGAPRTSYPPFAHLDQTRPERELRRMLQNFCMQKNASRGGNFETRRGNVDAFEFVTRVQYFHNGVQLFKKFTENNQIVPIQLEQNTELQHLHSIVITLKKYAQVFLDKKYSVILHNIPPSSDLNSLRDVVSKILQLPAIPILRKSPPVQIIRLNKNTRNKSTNNSFELVRIVFQNQNTQQPFITNFNANLPLLNGLLLYSQNSPNKFMATRDLTPPELALNYALGAYCSEKNTQLRHNHLDDYFYRHNFRIYERKKCRNIPQQ